MSYNTAVFRSGQHPDGTVCPDVARQVVLSRDRCARSNAPVIEFAAVPNGRLGSNAIDNTNVTNVKGHCVEKEQRQEKHPGGKRHDARGLT